MEHTPALKPHRAPDYKTGGAYFWFEEGIVKDTCTDTFHWVNINECCFLDTTTNKWHPFVIEWMARYGSQLKNVYNTWLNEQVEKGLSL